MRRLTKYAGALAVTLLGIGLIATTVDAKKLPWPYHDFRIVYGYGTVESEDVGVLCYNWRKVISVLERAPRMGDTRAKNRVNALNRNIECGFLKGVTLSITHEAIRGDSDGDLIRILRYEDDEGGIYYSGKYINFPSRRNHLE
jgi:hypothetical protein